MKCLNVWNLGILIVFHNDLIWVVTYQKTLLSVFFCKIATHLSVCYSSEAVLSSPVWTTCLRVRLWCSDLVPQYSIWALAHQTNLSSVFSCKIATHLSVCYSSEAVLSSPVRTTCLCVRLWCSDLVPQYSIWALAHQTNLSSVFFCQITTHLSVCQALLESSV